MERTRSGHGERGRGGFTLIELLVVIAILGILAAVAVPQLIGSRNKAREETCRDIQKVLQGQFANDMDSAKHGDVVWGGSPYDYAATNINTNQGATNTSTHNPWNRSEHAYEAVFNGSCAGNNPPACTVIFLPSADPDRFVVCQRVSPGGPLRTQNVAID